MAGRRGRRARKWFLAALALAALAISALFLVAGDDSPDSEIEAVRASLAAAKKESAGLWAVPQLDHARDLFDGAVREVSEQGTRPTFLRNYSRGRTLLSAARADAESARRAAAGEREEARSEAGNALRRARTMLEGARAAAQIAPSPRDGRVELARLRSELHEVEMALPDVQRLIDSGEFRAAATRGGELAARVEAAVSRFFGRIDRGDLRTASRDIRASAACPETLKELSLAS